MPRSIGGNREVPSYSPFSTEEQILFTYKNNSTHKEMEIIIWLFQKESVPLQSPLI